MTSTITNPLKGTKTLKITLMGQEVVEASAELIVQIPADVTEAEIAGMGGDEIACLIFDSGGCPEWKLGDIEDFVMYDDVIVEPFECAGEPDLRLIRNQYGDLVLAPPA